MPSTSDTAAADRLGRPLRDLRISVTDRCNLRCPYCMPADAFPADCGYLSREALLRFEEIARVVRAVVSLGVRKVRLTGGEPLMRRDLPALVRMLAGIPGVDDLALTTNGMLLARHAQALRDAGLQRVTVSLDALDPESFARLSGGRGDVESVLQGIDAARAAGFDCVKVNCVIVRGINDRGIVDMAERFRGTGIALRFIEFMDVGTLNRWRRDAVVPADEVVERIDARFPLTPAPPRYPGEVARRYRYADGAGEIGVIASVTRPFCGGCSRLRMSAEGSLYTCLFAKAGHALRPILRAGADDAALQARVAEVWRGREDRYSEERAASPAPRRVEMYHIGG